MNLSTLLEELSLFKLDPKFYFQGCLTDSIDKPMIPEKPLAFTDNSRRICLDPQYLSTFICVSGQKFDGHAWLESSLESQPEIQSLELILLDEQNEATPRILKKYRKNFIVVKNTRAALSLIWSTFHQHPEKDFLKLGVTGTNGKTSVTWLARELINNAEVHAPNTSKCVSIGTLGAIGKETREAASLTSPSPDVFFETLRRFLKNGYDCLATEVSSHAISQSRYFPTQFQVALISSFSRDHLDFHKSMACYLKEKLRIFTEMLASNGVAIFHESILFLDQDLVDEVKPVLKSLKKVIIYGGANSLERVKARVLEWNIEIEYCAVVRTEISDRVMQDSVRSKGVSIEVYKNFELQEAVSAYPPGFGEIYAQNYLGAALGVSELLGESLSNLAKRSTDPVPGRFQPIYHSDRMFIVDYAHTPEGLEIALKFCQSLRDSHSQPISSSRGNIWCVFGCGGDRDKGKRSLMGKAASLGADFLIVTSDNPRSEDPVQIANEIKLGIPIDFKHVSTILDRKEAIQQAVISSKPGDIILIAGKGHEDTQEIDGQKYKFSDLEVLQGQLGQRI
jgi:UDP-N-acetylmuramoyl-L-alanyl-D-glutamate--2,6-diaminopimelate ligase